MSSNLLYRFLGDASDFITASGKVQAELLATANQAAIAGVAIQAALAGAATVALYSAASYEELSVSFETMLGSASEAKSLLKDLANFQSPFDRSEIQQVGKELTKFGERGKEVTETLQFLGNAAAYVDKSIGELTTTYNRVRAAGRLLQQDFRKLANDGVLSLEDIAAHYGITSEAADKMVRDGKISFEDLKEILKEMSDEGGKFSGAMKKHADTFFGVIASMRDMLSAEVRKLGEELLPTAKMIASGLKTVLELLVALPQWIKTGAAAVVFLTASLAAAILVLGSLAVHMVAINAAMITMTGIGLGAMIMSVASVALPLLLVAVVAGTAAWLLYNEMIGKVNKSLEAKLALDQKLANLAAKGHRKEITGIKGMDTAAEAIPETDIAIENAKKGYKELMKQAGRANAELERLRSEGYDGLSPELKAATTQLEGLNLRTKETVKHVEDLVKLREDLSKLPPDAPPDPELVAGLRTYVDTIKEQVKTVGMSKQELVEYEYAQKKVGATLMGEVVEAHLALANAQKQSDAESYNKSLKEQIATLGMTSDELVRYRQEQDQVNAATREETIELQNQLAVRAKELEQRRELQSLLKDIAADVEASTQAAMGVSPQQQELDRLKGLGAGPGQLAMVEQAQAQIKASEDVVQAQQKAKDKIKSFNDELRRGAESLKESLKSPWETAGDQIGEYMVMLRRGLISTDEYKQAVGRVKDQFTETSEAAQRLKDFMMGTRKFHVSMEGIRTDTSSSTDEAGFGKALGRGQQQAANTEREQKQLQTQTTLSPAATAQMQQNTVNIIAAIDKIVTAIEANSSPGAGLASIGTVQTLELT